MRMANRLQFPRLDGIVRWDMKWLFSGIIISIGPFLDLDLLDFGSRQSLAAVSDSIGIHGRCGRLLPPEY
ncbi:hypothetical protein WG66_008705 [Moniliophthora roreri]|nr:hypothetical protein WG66_008705 [Moniliophthora roreri]